MMNTRLSTSRHGLRVLFLGSVSLLACCAKKTPKVANEAGPAVTKTPVAKAPVAGAWRTGGLLEGLAVSQRTDLLSARAVMWGRLIARLDGDRVFVTTTIEHPQQPPRCLVELLGPTGRLVFPLGEDVTQQLEGLRAGLKRCLGPPKQSPPPFIADPNLGPNAVHRDSPPSHAGAMLLSFPANTPLHTLIRLEAKASAANFDAVGYLVATPRGKAAHGVLWERMRCIGGLLPACRRDERPRPCRALLARLSPIAPLRVEELISFERCSTAASGESFRVSAPSFEALLRTRSAEKSKLPVPGGHHPRPVVS